MLRPLRLASTSHSVNHTSKYKAGADWNCCLRCCICAGAANLFANFTGCRCTVLHAIRCCGWRICITILRTVRRRRCRICITILRAVRRRRWRICITICVQSAVVGAVSVSCNFACSSPSSVAYLYHNFACSSPSSEAYLYHNLRAVRRRRSVCMTIYMRC